MRPFTVIPKRRRTGSNTVTVLPGRTNVQPLLIGRLGWSSFSVDPSIPKTYKSRDYNDPRLGRGLSPCGIPHAEWSLTVG